MEAMAELGLKSGIIVTRNEKKKIDFEGGQINIMPIWRFLLLPVTELSPLG